MKHLVLAFKIIENKFPDHLKKFDAVNLTDKKAGNECKEWDTTTKSHINNQNRLVTTPTKMKQPGIEKSKMGH